MKGNHVRLSYLIVVLQVLPLILRYLCLMLILNQWTMALILLLRILETSCKLDTDRPRVHSLETKQ
jgi:hypothetical protein